MRSAGRSAVLVTFDSLERVVAFRSGLQPDPAAVLPGVHEVVSGARTLLVRFDPARTDPVRLRSALGQVVPVPAEATTDADPVVVPVRYDGEDLDDVASAADMSVEALVAWHTGQVWTSAFCGFAPGFSYCTGTEPSLAVPRRSTARTSVPAGSVALAGEFSAVYPRSSPGGWQLIGRTEVAMWSLDRDPPALAPAGTRLRYVAVPS
ncbi:allophanate hydrolase [Curtobacterium sp. MCSS17_008]|nr:allophanate hydrolase [Curtobacterium sp. MCSS17_008]